MKQYRFKRKAIALLVGGAGLLGLGTASAASIDAAVASTVTAEGKARVIINLKQPEELASGWASLQASGEAAGVEAQIKELEESVLASVGGGLNLFYQYESVAGLAGEVTAEGLERLKADPAVESVTEDFFVELTHNESRPLIGADTAHAAGYRGQGVLVAVIDTGIDRNHVDLKNDIAGGRCFVTHGAGCSSSTDYQDRNGHGTHVSGTITNTGSTAPKGIAPDAEVYTYRVFNATGGASTADINAALDHIVRHNPFVAAVNLSLGSGFHSGTCNSVSPTTTALMKALYDRGTTVWVASGNNGWINHMSWPACITYAYAVGATYDTGANVDKVTSYSNSSGQLQVLAPGSWISSARLGGGTAWNWNGTSMATPHAAATAALVRSKNGTLSASQMLTAVRDTGKWIKDHRGNNRWTRRVRADAAINSVAKGLKPGWQWVKCLYANRTEGKTYSWCYASGIGWIYDFDDLIEGAFFEASASDDWIAIYVDNLRGNVHTVQLQ